MLGLASAWPAAADVELCNESRLLHYQAVLGYFDPAPKEWISRGWLVMAPGKCVMANTGPIANGALYLHAEYFVPARDGAAATAGAASAPGTISGNYGLCALKDGFEILGDKKCRSRGFDTVNAAEVKTGEARSVSIELFEGGQIRVTRTR